MTQGWRRPVALPPDVEPPASDYAPSPFESPWTPLWWLLAWIALVSLILAGAVIAWSYPLR